MIKESKRGMGMAKALLEEMISIAKSRKLSSIVAYVRSDNKAMIKVFEHHRFVKKRSDDCHEVILELALDAVS